MTLLVAGHDTTATGLSWALERLTRHPDALAKAVAAADASAAGDPAGDEYLDAVGKEMLRIRPVVPDVGRHLEGTGRGRGLSAARRCDGGAEHHARARTRRGVPASRIVRSGSDGGRDAEPVDVAAVRRRQSALSRCGFRDGRDAHRAAGDPAPCRIGHDDRGRRENEAQARHPHAEPWSADHGACASQRRTAQSCTAFASATYLVSPAGSACSARVASRTTRTRTHARALSSSKPVASTSA